MATGDETCGSKCRNFWRGTCVSMWSPCEEFDTHILKNTISTTECAQESSLKVKQSHYNPGQVPGS